MSSELDTTPSGPRRAHVAIPAGPPSDALPADLLADAARRLGAVSAVYAIVFFLANIGIPLAHGQIGEIFEHLRGWLPATISISTALVVLAISRNPHFSRPTLIRIGLLFEVAGSYGIAFAEFWGIYSDYPRTAENIDFFGLSWVAVWIMSFSVIAPTRPRYSLLAALAAASSVPVTLLLSMRHGGTLLDLSPSMFTAGVVTSYLIVVGLAFYTARIVYRLGTDIRRAREMGSYKLEELIGRGGMGEVWRARHQMLARPAAIKLIRPERLGTSDGRVLRRRFEREARATATLRSPHTVELYDYGVSETGVFHYVMELLDGLDLERLVREHGPQPPERVVRILRQVCRSLDEAHAVGLVHRDIKPANIYLCRYGRELDFVKVLDFGLAIERAHGNDDTQLTQQGSVVGSPAFMAPEMSTDSSAIDGRADLYSLGCVAYWLLSGKLVFEGDSPMEVLVKHARDEATPIDQLCEFELPSELSATVMSCLAKNPSQRPSSAAELCNELGRLEFPEPWTAERIGRWWSLHDPERGSSPVEPTR